FALMWNVSILLVRRSTTARVLPSGLIEIDDPPTALAERNVVELAMGSSCPPKPIWKPTTLPAPPWLRTYRRFCVRATATGLLPPDGCRFTKISCPPITRKTVISPLPAFTANRSEWSALNVSEPCASSGSFTPPVPLPCVSKVSFATTVPSELWTNSITWFLSALFDMTKNVSVPLVCAPASMAGNKHPIPITIVDRPRIAFNIFHSLEGREFGRKEDLSVVYEGNAHGMAALCADIGEAKRG